MYTVGGLFSGVGGIELGFEKAGFKVVWANEKNKNTCATYKKNFSHHNLIEKDIYNVNPADFNPVDVIVSGFPCQPFSVAGLREGLNDYRGNLFEHIIRFLRVLRPKVLFLENVKNLKTHDSGKTFKIMCDKLRNENYSIETIILNTSKYTSIPQNRERIFIICFKNEDKWWTRDPKLSVTNYFKEILENFKNKKINKKEHIFKSCLEKKKLKKIFTGMKQVKYIKEINLRK